MTIRTRKSVLTCALGVAFAASLSGCASFGTRPSAGNIVSARPAAVSVDATADWSWSVSGDMAVRPLQVFSLNGKTYLQMRAGQLIPAVVVEGQPVPFTISAPYIVVQGKPSRIDLLASGYRAVLVHRGPVDMPESPVVPDRVQRISDSSTLSSGAQTYPTASRGDGTREIIREPLPVAPTGNHRAIVDAAAAHQRVWRINPDQRLLSLALADWSRSAGIRLVWKSRVDVPITGAAEYHDGSFLVAMSHALADASGGGYRFFFSMTGNQTVTVVAIRAS